MNFTYTCKKADNYAVSFEFEDMPAETTAYFLRRGAREYFDNYHAGATRKSGASVGEIKGLIDEAYSRAVEGDVPSERGAAKPTSKRAVALKTATPEMLAKIDELLGLTTETAEAA